MPLGRALGALLRRLPLSFISTARRNIELCLPELDAAARERLLREHFASLGIALLEIPFAWWSRARAARAPRQASRAGSISRRRWRGAAASSCSPRTSPPWRWPAARWRRVTNVGFLYRPTKNEVLAYALERFRCGYGGRGIAKDDIRAFISALKSNECVWYAPDQSYRKKGAEMVPMFGIPAATNTLTSRHRGHDRRGGTAVFPAAPARHAGLRRPPSIRPSTDFPSDSAVADTAALQSYD